MENIIIFPWVFPILFPLVPLSFLLTQVSAMFGVIWPTRLYSWILRRDFVLLIDSSGDVKPGFLRKNVLGNVFAYEGVFPIFGEPAFEDGRVQGIFRGRWMKP